MLTAHIKTRPTSKKLILWKKETANQSRVRVLESLKNQSHSREEEESQPCFQECSCESQTKPWLWSSYGPMWLFLAAGLSLSVLFPTSSPISPIPKMSSRSTSKALRIFRSVNSILSILSSLGYDLALLILIELVLFET